MRKPPVKRAGTAKQARRFDGVLMDVKSVAELLGCSEHCIRSRTARGVFPHRRLGGRIVFLKNEIDQFLAELPGVDLGEVKRNLERRYDD